MRTTVALCILLIAACASARKPAPAKAPATVPAPRPVTVGFDADAPGPGWKRLTGEDLEEWGQGASKVYKLVFKHETSEAAIGLMLVADAEATTAWQLNRSRAKTFKKMGATVSAVAKLAADGSRSEFAVFGRGPDGAAFKSMLHARNIPDNPGRFIVVIGMWPLSLDKEMSAAFKTVVDSARLVR